MNGFRYKECEFSLNTEQVVAGLQESLQQPLIPQAQLEFSLPVLPVKYHQTAADLLF